MRSALPVPHHQWISSCHFHDVTQAQTLQEVARRVGEQKAKGEAHPLVLLDLDSTLYEVAHRTHVILNEFFASTDGRRFSPIAKSMGQLELKWVGYSLRDTFRAAGLDLSDSEVARALSAAKEFWIPRFFSSQYLPHDRPYPGAAAFTRKLHDLGAQIVYLTGRDEPRMGEGTKANLLRDGFPWEKDRTHLLLKREASIPDLDHKKSAADYIRKHGVLIASFENEPVNIAALYQIFPDAMHVFVETVFSDHDALPCQGLYRIQGFESLA